MRTVLRKGSTAKTESVSDPQAESSGGSEPTKSAPPKSTAPKTTTAPAQDTTTKPAPEPTVFSHWGAIQEEKARALFAKYGLTLEPGEWKSPNPAIKVQRVAKPIRMRVRRNCHRCQTTFGPDKLCVNCQHVRCKKCPRYPAAKSHDHTETALQTILAQKDKEPTGVQRKVKEPPLTLPSRTGGQDLTPRSVTAANILDAKSVLETRPSYTSILMAILEMLSLLRNHQHELGGNLVNVCDTFVTSVQPCIDQDRTYARVVARRKVQKLYETPARNKSLNLTRKL
ncbi:hypothetical protein BBP40_002102 [Aspergillus hancockii]|nr:hypothetical protein BBP40_002102 [Aspergillus hancockii]